MFKSLSKAPVLGKALAATAVLLAMMPIEARTQMGSPAAGTSAAAATGDPLTMLNGEFRTIYNDSRTRLVDKSLPLIICIGDKLVLIDKDLREEAQVIPPLYTQLKVVDHVPLALFVLLDPVCGQTLDEKTNEKLKRIKTLVAAVRPTLAGLSMDTDTLNRQYLLIDSSVDFLRTVEKKQTVSHKTLVDFCRELEPMVMKNVDQAVAAELKAIDETVVAWRQKLGPERFSKISVVIVSGHMPRQRHTTFQYFSKLLHEKNEGLRIVYSEGAEEEGAARQLLATHVLDASIGETFFKEKLRMHRDLLSDGAARYLSAHPPLSSKTKAQH